MALYSEEVNLQTFVMIRCKTFSHVYAPLNWHINEMAKLHSKFVHKSTQNLLKCFRDEGVDVDTDSSWNGQRSFSVDSLFDTSSIMSTEDVVDYFQSQCNQIFIGMVTMQYQARQVGKSVVVATHLRFLTDLKGLKEAFIMSTIIHVFM